MRFVISGLGLDSAGGLTVGLNVVRCLPVVDRKNQYCLVFPEGCGYENVEVPGNWEMRLMRVKPKCIRRPYLDHMWLPELCRRFGAEAAFSMSNYSAYGLPCPHIVGMHNACLLYDIATFQPAASWRDRMSMWARRSYFRFLARRADAFCVLTSVLQSRLHAAVGVPVDRIRVVPNAVASELRFDSCCNGLLRNQLAQYERRFRLCYVAAFYHHKNHEILIQVVRELQRRQIRDVVVFLTLDCDHNPLAARFMARVSALGLDDQLVNVGRLPLADVPVVYGHSDALLMPTLLESFSNSYIEAMYCGLPILTSNLDFAHAVCGDAAIYFDPQSPASVADSIMRLRGDDLLRQSLRTKGDLRLRRLAVTWEDVTRQYVAILEEFALVRSRTS